MRRLITLLLVALPALADAQSHPADRQPGATPGPRPPAGWSLPPIGLPLPDITPTLAPLGLPTPADGPRQEHERAPRGPRHVAGSRGWGPRSSSVIYVVPAYLAESQPEAAPPPATAEPLPEPTGTLWLDVEPRAAEVHVDGALVGTTLDLGGALALPAGLHRVELRADGYDSMDVSVRVEAAGAVTLRRVLQPQGTPAPPPAAPSASITRKPFYLVPGCYLGDVPPEEAGLPARCDLTKTVIVRR
ncbi:MAG: hypothetical protein AB7O93_00310 [Vicinamibacterales bacterium]